MAVKLSSIGHVNITARDMEKSRDFYCRILGFDQGIIEEDPEHGSSIHLELPGLGLAIGPLSDPSNEETPPKRREKVGVMHVAFKVATYEDLKEAYETLIENGIAVRSLVDHVTQRSIMLEDPDGNGVEIYYEYPTALYIYADGRGDRDDHFTFDDPLPDFATWAGLMRSSPEEWRQDG
ncbi:MAG: VOC family protein [Dehalococcoidia bacterium]